MNAHNQQTRKMVYAYKKIIGLAVLIREKLVENAFNAKQKKNANLVMMMSINVIVISLVQMDIYLNKDISMLMIPNNII